MPADWVDNNNIIEVIGAGGGGGNPVASTSSGGGGGGGAYSQITNLPLTPGAAINVSIGGGGGAQAAGGDTWFSSTATVLAKGGAGASNATGGGGGASTSGVGTIKYAGGGGGNSGATAPSGGGGGAGGRYGSGGGGGLTTGGNTSGCGGGGGGGGQVGANSGISTGGNGANANGVVSGTGGNAVGVAGASSIGSSGGGGGGGATPGNGGGGGNGADFDLTHGSGGGGGGAGSASGSAGNGGGGGRYGAGGGGGSQFGAALGTPGVGAQGIIVIRYGSGGAVPDVYTTLLLHCDGTNGSTVFPDSSIYAHGNATVAGSVTVSTAQSKFGGGSALFTGGADYLSFPNSADWEFGAGDFTIDWWEYRTSATTGKTPIARDALTTFAPFLLGYSDGTNSVVYMSSNGSSWDIASGQSLGAIQLNAWHHFAVTRQGNTFRTYKDGSQVATWTSALALKANSNPFSLSRIQSGANYYSGHLEEVRVSKGIARWTGTTFTPPTAPYS